jgi:membrane fusion protein (multidrug efflux system)
MTRADWILTGALADGDQVIVAGIQKVKPGGEARIATPAEANTAPAPPQTKP